MNKIANLKPGDDGVYIEALINHVVSGKTNGAHRSTYLSMTLQDDTGSIDAKLWNATDEQVQNLVKGTVVQIKGDVIKYNEDRQMKIVKIHTGTQDDKERIRFLKQAPLDGQFMIHEIKKFIDQIDNLKLHQLVKTLFEENIEKLNSEIEKYRKQYEEDTEKLKELTSNPEALEKIAREKYLMKKPNEDVYVFEQ